MADSIKLHIFPCPSPHTLHRTPCTLHPAPYTLHSTLYTLHPLHPLHSTPSAPDTRDVMGKSPWWLDPEGNIQGLLEFMDTHHP